VKFFLDILPKEDSTTSTKTEENHGTHVEKLETSIDHKIPINDSTTSTKAEENHDST
jgi:hypothetical protein